MNLLRIGTGAFSEVYKVTRKSDRQEYALKQVTLNLISLITQLNLLFYLGQTCQAHSEREGQLYKRGTHPCFNQS